jgi:Tfp pilus assembly protein PilV
MKIPMYKRNSAGLTLVEVLVSVTFTAVLLAGLSVPLSIGLINRQQGQNITEATNIAQAEMERIRGTWLNSTASAVIGTSVGQSDFDNNNIKVDWRAPNASAPCVVSAATTLTNVYTAGNVNLSRNDTVNNLLSNPSLLAPSSVEIPIAVRSIAIDSNGDCRQDYWGQIIFGNAPDSTGTARIDRTKRVVIRIFRLQTNPSTLTYTPVNAARPTNFAQSSTMQNGVSIMNLPLAVVIADIPRS